MYTFECIRCIHISNRFILTVMYLKFIGGLDNETLSPVDYRTELRVAKARVDMPAHSALCSTSSAIARTVSARAR